MLPPQVMRGADLLYSALSNCRKAQRYSKFKDGVDPPEQSIGGNGHSADQPGPTAASVPPPAAAKNQASSLTPLHILWGPQLVEAPCNYAAHRRLALLQALTASEVCIVRPIGMLLFSVLRKCARAVATFCSVRFHCTSSCGASPSGCCAASTNGTCAPCGSLEMFDERTYMDTVPCMLPTRSMRVNTRRNIPCTVHCRLREVPSC